MIANASPTLRSSQNLHPRRDKKTAPIRPKPDRRRRNDFIPRVRQLNQRNTALVSTMDHSV
jgi:hypothetical protein